MIELKNGAYILKDPRHQKDPEILPNCKGCREIGKGCCGNSENILILLYFEETKSGIFLAPDGTKSNKISHENCERAIKECGLLDFVPAETIMGLNGKIFDVLDKMMGGVEHARKMFYPDLAKLKN